MEFYGGRHGRGKCDCLCQKTPIPMFFLSTDAETEFVPLELE